MKRLLLILLLALPACREETAELPSPVDITETALSHYCQMNIAEHGGPKGQVHLAGLPDPLFFAQVRDLITYLKSPERDARVLTAYVSDMGAAPSWAQPGNGNWIAADSAVFVVGAAVAGGMGAPEIVPFSDRSAADAFADRYGGAVFALEQIPDSAVGPVDLDAILETPS